jgi:hypothetical protein
MTYDPVPYLGDSLAVQQLLQDVIPPLARLLLEISRKTEDPARDVEDFIYVAVADAPSAKALVNQLFPDVVLEVGKVSLFAKNRQWVMKHLGQMLNADYDELGVDRKPGEVLLWTFADDHPVMTHVSYQLHARPPGN